MFSGEYKHTVDNKKRMALPAKFRRELGKKIVVTRGIDKCLIVYPEKEWNKKSSKIEKLPEARREARDYSRIILGGAMYVTLDKLGRILLPDYLKKYAGLKKDVVVCGLSNRFEIWDTKKWKNFKERVEPKVDKMASNLEELGI